VFIIHNSFLLYPAQFYSLPYLLFKVQKIINAVFSPCYNKLTVVIDGLFVILLFFSGLSGSML